jgi:tetratricopeptide (TPR) repeat protein
MRSRGRTSSLSSLLLSLCALCVLCGKSPAQLDPELKKPYQLQVVLHIADHRFLTPLFRKQVERELADHLRLTYGPLARVEVVHRHPLLTDIHAKGLQQALDGWEELSERKTHFVLIDYVHGRYELQTRQYDGMTGLASPVVRLDRTGDGALVARQAARLVDRDFGLVGTVVEVGKEVKVAIKGGGLGVALDRWIKPGEVFAIARLRQEGETRRAARVPWALLQVLSEPKDGIVRCRFHHRFQGENLAGEPGVIGYRCLKLTTTSGPLRLRLIDKDTFQPLSGLDLQISQSGDFQKAETLSTKIDGQAQSKEALEHMGVVQVHSGNLVHAQFPVEIVDERTVVVRLKISQGSEAAELLHFRKDLWVRRIYDDLRLASDRFTELNALLAKSLEAVLETARPGFKSMDEELTSLTLERAELERQAKDRKVPLATLDLREGDQRLAELRSRQQDLQKFIGRLEEAVKQSERNRAVAKLVARAQLLETEADFEQAIKVYEKVVKDYPEQTKIASHLEGLKKAWQPRSEEHVRARKFVYETWPTVETGELKDKLPQARKELDVLKQAGDRLTPQRLLRANERHTDKLRKHLDSLKSRRDSEDTRAAVKAIGQIAEALERLHTEAAALVRKKE